MNKTENQNTVAENKHIIELLDNVKSNIVNINLKLENANKGR